MLHNKMSDHINIPLQSSATIKTSEIPRNIENKNICVQDSTSSKGQTKQSHKRQSYLGEYFMIQSRDENSELSRFDNSVAGKIKMHHRRMESSEERLSRMQKERLLIQFDKRYSDPQANHKESAELHGCSENRRKIQESKSEERVNKMYLDRTLTLSQERHLIANSMICNRDNLELSDSKCENNSARGNKWSESERHFSVNGTPSDCNRHSVITCNARECHPNLKRSQSLNDNLYEKLGGQKKPEEKEFTCPETTGNGNYADPATCRRFYQCVDGYPYLNRCPSGLFFDDISKLCTFKNEARCGPLSTTPAPSTEPPVDLARKCDTSECSLPYCYCSRDGTIIPGGLDPEDTPQMILLTFDGAINLNNYDRYQKVFADHIKNPNGCEIKGTFFISHEYCNYNMVQQLAHEGHEIGTETISLQQNLQDKGYEEWVGEMIGMREILRHFASIPKNNIVGMRAPYLKPGRNTQYEVLEDFGYIYDSSVGVPPLKVPVWPYTLDYKIPHECRSGTCPTRSFQGVWEVPLNAHYVETYEGGHCPYLDQCVLHNHDSDEVFEWLKEDFNRYYLQNRAPYMMPFHTNWFQIKELEGGLHKFLEWAKTLPDVWFVTVTQALIWMTDPRPAKNLNNFEPWDCKKQENIPPKPCNLPTSCALPFRPPEANVSAIRYLVTCKECPARYPWIGDVKGTGIEGSDVYEPET